MAENNSWGILLHFMFAFFVPGAWAIILYPYFRWRRKTWTTMVVFAVFFSIAAMVLKEKIDQQFSVDDVVADMLGVFLGTAFLSAIFTIGSKGFSKEISLSGQRVTLRSFLLLARELEERAALFYYKASADISDSKTQAICIEIGKDEKRHAASISSVLGAWLPETRNKNLDNWARNELVRRGSYELSFSGATPPEQVLRYAIGQERNNIEFYMLFKSVFPQEWKKSYVQMVLTAEQEHIRKLEEALARR